MSKANDDDKHKTLPPQLLECPICGEQCGFGKEGQIALGNHIKYVCAFTKVECEGCGAQVYRSEIKVHECPPLPPSAATVVSARDGCG
jgi:hypothetical protein